MHLLGNTIGELLWEDRLSLGVFLSELVHLDPLRDVLRLDVLIR